MSSTETADYVFTVKEGAPPESGNHDAPVWLMCEPRTHELSIVGSRGYLGIRLKPGVKIAEAETIKKYLQDHVDGISYTKY